MNEPKLNEFKGFSLFNDIEDQELRTRNRAVVLCNMAQDHSKNRKVSPMGSALILGYFLNVPDEEKMIVKDAFVGQMAARGFHLVEG